MQTARVAHIIVHSLLYIIIMIVIGSILLESKIISDRRYQRKEVSIATS